MTNATKASAQLRSNIRSFLLTATHDELRAELQLSLDRYDNARAEVIRELMVEEGVLEVIETGVINKDNWTGEEANVQGWFDADEKVIDFDLNGQSWRLTFQTWNQIDGPNFKMMADRDALEDLVRLIGSGVWALTDATAVLRGGQVFIDAQSFGKPTTIENGEGDFKTPVDVLASAARWVWKYV